MTFRQFIRREFCTTCQAERQFTVRPCADTVGPGDPTCEDDDCPQAIVECNTCGAWPEEDNRPIANEGVWLAW